MVVIEDPCVTELTTPLTFPDMSMTYGDTNTELDISIAISSVDYDFCAYDLLIDSWQAGSTNKATLVQFSNI